MHVIDKFGVVKLVAQSNYTKGVNMERLFFGVALALCALLSTRSSNSGTSGDNAAGNGGDSSTSRCTKVLMGGTSTCPLSLSAAVTTLAGSGGGGSADGTGTAATFNSPRIITTDGTSLYLADQGNNRIRKIQ
jgi:hypothetical protein